MFFADVLYGDSRCSQTCCRCSQVLPGLLLALRGVPKPLTNTPMVLLYQSSEIPVTLKAGRNALLGVKGFPLTAIMILAELG